MNSLERIASKFPSTTITINGKPYLTRYYVFMKDRDWGNIYIHHFHSSDQPYELHNHPFKGFAIVLWGGYVEERARNPLTWEEGFIDLVDDDFVHPHPVSIEYRDVRPGMINLIRSTDFHRVDLKDETKGSWSLFFAGPRNKDWGFLNRETAEYKSWKTNPEAIP